MATTNNGKVKLTTALLDIKLLRLQSTSNHRFVDNAGVRMTKTSTTPKNITTVS